jgi:Caspase domain
MILSINRNVKKVLGLILIKFFLAIFEVEISVMVVFLLASALPTQAAQPELTPRATVSALLIGVSSYPFLSPDKQLRGPENDVIAMHHSLTVAGIKPEFISVMADRSSLSIGLPTKKAILDQLIFYAKKLHSGDKLIVYFSGHGTQQPVAKKKTSATYQEPDGLDEVFLPYDTKRWDLQKKQIEGGLLDDEIGMALQPLLDKGISVWAIFDTCHAGDMAKSYSYAESKVRSISPLDLGVPAAELPTFRALVSRRSEKVHRQGAGHLIAFYASQPDESAQEELLPTLTAQGVDKVNKRYYGVLTYHLAQLLSQHAPSSANLSQLASRLAALYRAKPFPHPMFTGPMDLNLNFLSDKP